LIELRFYVSPDTNKTGHFGDVSGTGVQRILVRLRFTEKTDANVEVGIRKLL